jgi:hypothetical protein
VSVAARLQSKQKDEPLAQTVLDSAIKGSARLNPNVDPITMLRLPKLLMRNPAAGMARTEPIATIINDLPRTAEERWRCACKAGILEAQVAMISPSIRKIRTRFRVPVGGCVAASIGFDPIREPIC